MYEQVETREKKTPPQLSYSAYKDWSAQELLKPLNVAVHVLSRGVRHKQEGRLLAVSAFSFVLISEQDRGSSDVLKRFNSEPVEYVVQQAAADTSHPAQE